MRGRFIFAVLALAAFCATYAAPVQPFLSRGMSCCGSGKTKSCCKRGRGPGWVATSSSCAGQCACGLPSAPAAPLTVAASGPSAAPAYSFVALVPNDCDSAPELSQPSLHQRPPPTTV